MERINELTQKLDRAKILLAETTGRLAPLEGIRAAKENEARTKNRQASILEIVAEAFRLSSESAREEARKAVESAGTEALQAVFGPEFSLQVELSDRGGRPSAEFFVASNYGGVEIVTPVMDSRGGGVVDVVSLALRVLVAYATTPAQAPIVLDEPGKHLSEGYSRALGELIRAISEETGRQFVVVTHDPRLAEVADVAYTVGMENGVSRVARA